MTNLLVSNFSVTQRIIVLNYSIQEPNSDDSSRLSRTSSSQSLASQASTCHSFAPSEVSTTQILYYDVNMQLIALLQLFFLNKTANWKFRTFPWTLCPRRPWKGSLLFSRSPMLYGQSALVSGGWRHRLRLGLSTDHGKGVNEHSIETLILYTGKQ